MNPRILKQREHQIDYTIDQQKALLLITNFIASKDNFFLLIGNAGTGKTTIAENIANYSNAYMLAPTNAAVKRLLDKFGQIGKDRFRTIHQILYNYPDPETGEFRLGDGLRKNGVYIVDECSMIDTVVLADLMASAKKEETKLIFIGDDFQLEPVGKDPKIFEWENHPELAEHFLPHWKIKLFEVKRNEGAILQIATHLRSSVGKGKPEIININNDEFAVVDDFSRNLATNISNNDSYVVLVSNNKDRIKYNNRIRKFRFKEDGTKCILNGDRLISISNKSLVNGDIFTVFNPIVKENFVASVNVGTHIKPLFKDLTFHIIEYKEYPASKYKRITLLISNIDLPSIHPSQLMTAHAIKYNKILTKTATFGKGKDWQDNVSITTYGYATSVHKSQGNEWDNVYIDCGYLPDSWNKSRWLYTAVTRAKKKIELMKSFQFKTIKYAKLV